MASVERESTTVSVEAMVLETLISRGWRFRDPDEIRALVRTHETLPSTSMSSSSTSSSSPSVDAIESELLNMDLRSFGGKSLPDPSTVRKSSYLQGPKVLQLVSVRDIYQNSIDASFKNSQHQRRLLRFVLTDGLSEITAVEYVPVPSITEDIIPGSKVCLEGKVPMHSGILCLNPKVVTIVGGLVQSLHEEWQMSRKYSGFSRLSLRSSQNDDGVGPPQFEKLQIEDLPCKVSQQHGLFGSTVRKMESNHAHHIVDKRCHSSDTKAQKVVHDLKIDSVSGKIEDNGSSSETRPKEVSDAVPVQNQAAAQKLLQKMSQPTREDKHGRGHKYRGKSNREENHVFTLDEWEKRKGSSSSPLAPGNLQDLSQDEELARQLQNQLDLEDFHGPTGNSEADRIRMSMFSFSGAGEQFDGRRDFRGRGRVRGRGRGRGRR